MTWVTPVQSLCSTSGPTGKLGYLLVTGVLQIQCLHRSTLLESHTVLHRPGTFKSSITIRRLGVCSAAATGAPKTTSSDPSRPTELLHRVGCWDTLGPEECGFVEGVCSKHSSYQYLGQPRVLLTSPPRTLTLAD